MIESVAVIIFSSCRQKVLLIKRRDVPVFALPGGGVEANETFEEAAIRETQEETGLTVKIKRTIAYYYPINKIAFPTVFFECEPISGTLSLSSETSKVEFFPLSNLPAYLPPPYPDWIQDACKDQKAVFKPIASVTYRKLIYYIFCYPSLVFRFVLSRMNRPINT
jgi:8-oxo-dGTP pyrophosphatase MutT (NUDIX family)